MSYKLVHNMDILLALAIQRRSYALISQSVTVVCNRIVMRNYLLLVIFVCQNTLIK
uniref:Uncharacterized protein n=1 Tax=Arundo donax TaxID=35708 RepID=A0A0A9FCM1_ARUDO